MCALPLPEEHVSDDIEQLQARSSRLKPAVVTALDLRVTCRADRQLGQSALAFVKAIIHHRMSSIAPSQYFFVWLKTFLFLILEKKKRAKLTFRDFLAKADLALSLETCFAAV